MSYSDGLSHSTACQQQQMNDLQRRVTGLAATVSQLERFTHEVSDERDPVAEALTDLEAAVAEVVPSVEGEGSPQAQPDKLREQMVHLLAIVEEDAKTVTNLEATVAARIPIQDVS